MEAPEAYKTAGLINRIAGGFSVFVGLMWCLSSCWVLVGFIFLIPMAANAYQAYIGLSMKNGEANPGAKNAAIAGIVGGLFCFNIFVAAASVYAFMQVNDEEVAGWIESNS